MKKFVMLLMFSGMVTASCYHGGYTYPEGAIRGTYICINGTWIRR